MRYRHPRGDRHRGRPPDPGCAAKEEDYGRDARADPAHRERHRDHFRFTYGRKRPQGLALASLYAFFTFPLTLYAAFLGILSITAKQGRIDPGTIALAVTLAAVLYAVYSMAQEGLS